MSGFINNYYYGKAGKADYTPDQLPSNRVQLFFEMLRIRFSGLIGVNLLYLLFCLPAIVWTMLNVAVLNASVTQDATGAVSSSFMMDGTMFMYLLIMVPCLVIAGVGAPGEMYILRNWARDQHAFVLSDFKEKIKENWKCGALAGLVNGLSLLVTFVCYIYYGQMGQQNMLFLLPQMLVIVFCALWWMMNMQIFTMMVTYQMTFRQMVRNSAIMTLARLPWALLFFLGSLAVPFVLIFFVPYGELICILLYLLIGFALTGFVYASFSISCFDRYLNPRIEGAPVNMGLRDPELDDDDDDMEDPNPLT